MDGPLHPAATAELLEALVPGPSAGQSYSDLRHGLAAVWSQAAAAHERARELRQRMASVRAETAVLRQAIRKARSDRQSLAAPRDQLQQSEHAQMAARLQTMPVIEQAKAIVMAESRCGQAEAFDILRRASQQSNVPVRDLAAQIVQATIQGQSPAPARLPSQRHVSGQSDKPPRQAGFEHACGHV